MTKYYPGKVKHCSRCNAELQWDRGGFWAVHEIEDCVVYLAQRLSTLELSLSRVEQPK